jgi:16S rRNA (cytosine1402-N4)-methyltransferase
MQHISVLFTETIESLNLEKGLTIVDCTLGLAGHSSEILKKIGETGFLIGFDADTIHLEEAKQKLQKISKNFLTIHNNFAQLKNELAAHEISKIDCALFDLGIASPHIDQGERGFSFMHDGPLDMRLDKRQTQTAAEIVNTYSFEQLAKIFREYGEEKNAGRIARIITEQREKEPFQTTLQLANLIMEKIGRREKIHPATRIFQALRIEVNQELENLESAIYQAAELLNQSGRIAIISFHSLEDRIVKKAFKKLSTPITEETLYDKNAIKEPAKFKLITTKPITPNSEEIAANKRARSAKLRVIEKISN